MDLYAHNVKIILKSNHCTNGNKNKNRYICWYTKEFEDNEKYYRGWEIIIVVDEKEICKLYEKIPTVYIFGV